MFVSRVLRAQMVFLPMSGATVRERGRQWNQGLPEQKHAAVQLDNAFAAGRRAIFWRLPAGMWLAVTIDFSPCPPIATSKSPRKTHRAFPVRWVPANGSSRLVEAGRQRSWRALLYGRNCSAIWSTHPKKWALTVFGIFGSLSDWTTRARNCCGIPGAANGRPTCRCRRRNAP